MKLSAGWHAAGEWGQWTRARGLGEGEGCRVASLSVEPRKDVVSVGRGGTKDWVDGRGARGGRRVPPLRAGGHAGGVWSGGVGLEWTQERGLAVAVDQVLSTGRMIYGWSWRGAGILVRRKCQGSSGA
eukprot:scaffold15456_cov62-Phaeocystis_antarctica.AAC.2